MPHNPGTPTTLSFTILQCDECDQKYRPGDDIVSDANHESTFPQTADTTFLECQSAPRYYMNMHDLVDAPWIDLTSRQRSLWLGINGTGDSRLFQFGVQIKLARVPDLQLLQRAFGDVVRRHDALRLIVDPNLPRQRVGRTSATAIRLVDFSDRADSDSAAQQSIDKLFAGPFYLDESPLLQLFVALVASERCWLVFRVHHIVTDANSFSIIIKDVLETYNALERALTIERPRSSYRTFQQADTAYSASSRFTRDLEYWQARLRQLPEPLFVKRPNSDNDAGPPALRQEIEHSRFQQFLSQCSAQKIQAGNALLALGAWLMTSMQGRDELVLGVAYPGRTKDDQDCVGMFSGVMPLRVMIPAGVSLPELAAEIARSTRRDYLHHRCPIDDIRRNLGANQRHRETLFDAIVSYMPLDIVDFDAVIGSEPIRVTPLRGSEANPIVIYISELNKDQSATLEFTFNRKYLTGDEVALVADGFNRLFDAFIESPQAPLQHVGRLRKNPVDREHASLISSESPAPQQRNQVRIISSFTSAPIEAPLQFWLGRTGIQSSLTFADYNQLFQELLSPRSPARHNRRGVNVVLLRLQDWLRERGQSGTSEDDAQFLSRVADDFVKALLQAARASEVPYLLLICPPSPEWDSCGRREDLQELLMTKLTAGLAGITNVDVITYRDLRDLYPVETEYDATGDQLGHLPYTTSAFAAMATLVARRCHLMLRTPIKVIVADCDNTLWDGVAGEEGPHGITISDRHRHLQSRLVEAVQCGVLVCLCSKNVEEDVVAVFRERTDMVLKWGHIVGHKINWQSKSENIRELAREFNLGLDSFLFLDDNPVEIAEVASAHSEVTGIRITMTGPGATQFNHLWPLDCRQVTSEDAKRAESYRQNQSRLREREKADSFSDFIAGLGLQVRIDQPNDTNLARLEQLTERTNQFNINNVKRSGVALAEQNAAGRAAVLAVSVSDKFGDYGIVGLLAVLMEDEDLLVNTFLMSCRVLGRGVEHRMISEIGRLALEFGATRIRIPVRITARNLPVRQFLESIDGQHLTEAADQTHMFSPAVAAECRFRPDNELEAVEETVSASSTVSEVGRVDATVWNETATTFASVVEVEKAIRAATTGVRNPQGISRRPQTPTEQILADLFCQALGLEAIGADDDFFDLGVYSLLAVQLVSRIRERFSSQLSIRTLFEHSTIARLAEAIEQHLGAGYQAVVPLQIADDFPALFCCHPANGDAVCYMRLTKAMGSDQTVYGFEASGLSPGEPMAHSLEEMAASYVKAMVAAQFKGPYHLLGWSFGGVLAFEIARQLHQSGREVGFLGFMDAFAPVAKPLTEEVSIEQIDEAKFLQVIAKELNTIRRYSGFPPLSETDMTWQAAIEGYQAIGIVPKDYSIDDMRRKMLVYGNCGLLYSKYRPSPIPIPIVHFQASQNVEDWDFDWRPYTTKQVRPIWIRCNHYRMGFEPNINVVAAHLRALIRGDRRALGWWRRSPLANPLDKLIGRLALARG